MKFLGSAVAGLLGGVALLLLTVFTLLRPVIWPGYQSGLPAEYLAPDAPKWRPVPNPPTKPQRLIALPGGRFAATLDAKQALVFDPATATWTLQPIAIEPWLGQAARGGPAPTFWAPVSATEALAAYFDPLTGTATRPCQVFLEPAHAPLPPLQACDSASAGTRLSSGAALVVGWDGAAKVTRSFLLGPGATTWTNLGPMPDVGNGQLLAGAGERAVFGGTGERLALYADGAWKRLPGNVEPRYASLFALADDGAVLVVGGQQNEAGGKSTGFALLPFVALAGLIALAIVGKVRWKASAGGMAAGCLAALVLGGLALLLLLPMFAWH